MCRGRRKRRKECGEEKIRGERKGMVEEGRRRRGG
jgi:hypothetical protein